jgi:diacylglycerol kinase
MKKDRNGHFLFEHFKSYKYAWSGLREIFFGELNFQILLFFSIVVVIVGFIVELNSIEWIILAFTLTFLLVSEAFNKSIETACDAICTDFCEEIRFAKDVAAGAVLLVAMLSVAVITVIFWPYFAVVFGCGL